MAHIAVEILPSTGTYQTAHNSIFYPDGTLERIQRKVIFRYTLRQRWIAMFDYKLESVEKKLRKLYEKGRLSHREIYVFGVSESTRQIIQILRSFHLEPN